MAKLFPGQWGPAGFVNNELCCSQIPAVIIYGLQIHSGIVENLLMCTASYYIT